MRTDKLLIIVLLIGGMLAAVQEADAQGCTVDGQNPATAFPVCGTSVFSQKSVPVCGNGIVPSPTCVVSNRISYSALNPFWYKFTCFESGTLGFLISPNDSQDDYDWQLYDVTGRSLNAVFTDATMVVASNWSGITGITGTSATATAMFECASTSIPATGPPKFSKLPTLIKGHNYLLLVSHFSGGDQSGYQLSFNGGTASITDSTPPAIKSASPICDGTRIRIALNKNMQCSTLAADGSDFTLSPSPAGIRIEGAYAVNCSGFELDTLVVVTNGPLPAGDYSVVVNQGTDGNSILDICGTPIPVGQSVSFHMVPPGPTPLDSIVPVGCAPDVLQLVFPKKINCSTIAGDGSDFTVLGSTLVTVVGAYGECDTANLSYRVLVKLSAPLLNAGNYRIYLAPGSDGNTLVDECGFTSPAGSLPFTTGDTVSADLLTDQVLLGCKTDTIVYHYPSVNGVNQWQWIFDGADTSLLQDPPTRLYPVFDTKNVRLVVSNGYCTDTANLSPILGNAIDAGLEVPDILCPKDYAAYLNKSTGTLDSWNWDFGDGATFSGETPPEHLYPLTGIETKYTVTLVVGNTLGCYDTAAQQIDVLRSCYIAVPNAFTPNGDGLNDFLYPLNAYKADNLSFKVFNRFGQMVFESHEWTQKWDGTLNGHAEPTGTYVWMLDYVDRDTGKHIFQKGTALLIR
ncbi:gliding motility-associated C-terminal domain-containing protein [Puia sp.]|jgi:gliding motility-associated-like protein|uniref:T9SS type B sorting domain-containing protein n=1 Tax=Puia sp. TaxID=2045100 RepID=UPI002F3E6137